MNLRFKRALLFFILGFSLAGLPVFMLSGARIKANQLQNSQNGKTMMLLEGNTLIPAYNPTNPVEVARVINVVATAYSSTVWETDDTPFTTAAGTKVKDGIIANNMLPFGTKIRIPELYGDKVFTVEDRMNWKKGNYQIDIWFASHLEAKEFGAKRTYIEILES